MAPTNMGGGVHNDTPITHNHTSHAHRACARVKRTRTHTRIDSVFTWHIHERIESSTSHTKDVFTHPDRGVVTHTPATHNSS